MTISILQKIAITDSDIDEIEELFGDIVFDEPRRAIIKNLDSVDIQAFPGSGKTTILVAKLAILAKKWPYDNKGICVLSHTNTAREEIESRLGKTDIGKKLLSYPHFIGTVHSFCNTYIGIPWLRSNGYPITLIDTEIVLKQRWKKLRRGTRTYLERRQKTEYACEAIHFPNEFDIGCSKESASYIDLYNVVSKSQECGYFTFDEMLHIAKYTFEECKTVGKAIQVRFPILFVDEAQDTSDLQWGLIDSSFNDDTLSIKQSFGDANQAIFQSHSNQKCVHKFPLENNMTIPDSYRFGSAIANLADPLAISQKGLRGESKLYEKNDGQHTVFLFDKKTPEVALKAYAKQILNCFTDEEIKANERLGCYVVGMIHNTEPRQVNDPHFPVGIRDYWMDYDPNAGKTISRSRYLIDYFRRGYNSLIETKNYSNYLEFISSAFRKIINVTTPNKITPLGKAYTALLKSISVEKQQNFRMTMLSLVQLPFCSEDEWNVVVDRCKEILGQYFDISIIITPEDTFYKWNGDDNFEKLEDSASILPKNNIYHYLDEETGRELDIQFDSIHSVKGRTHLATMVVETYWYASNLKSIIPWLCNQSPKKIGLRNETRLKCHYVALTRARGLICVALPKDHVSADEINLLQVKGWNVVDL